MPALTHAQLTMLEAYSGAFSEVTPTEASHDGSITIDRFEKEVLSQKYLLQNFKRRGGTFEDMLPDRYKFNVFSPPNIWGFRTLELPIVYPKAEKSELRLYMQKSFGFGCNPHDFFLIFNRRSEPYPVVGFIPRESWDEFWLIISRMADQRFSIRNQDQDDSAYQQEVLLSQAGEPVHETRMRQPRDPSIAKQALENSNYHCDFDSTHFSFISPVTSRQYMEAHHLIPMSYQSSFFYSLDFIGNVVSLCPTCHKKIHLGMAEDKRNMLLTLCNKKSSLLQTYGVDFESLCSFYNA